MSRIEFVPERRVVSVCQGTATVEELAAVQPLYAASPRFAVEHGGPLVEKLLESVPASWFQDCEARGLLPNIDLRVHRLYPGVFPAFPGWHCDTEYRETYFSQPDLERTPVSRTLVATVSTHPCGVSRTEFMCDRVTADVDTTAEDFVLWREVHKQVEEAGPFETWLMPDGVLTEFSNMTLHRALPATRRGWRLFFRMSMWHRPYLGTEGKLSKQETVYQVLEGMGW